MTRRAYDADTEQAIIGAYVDERLTMRQIAARVGGTDVAVANVLKRHGVARRPAKRESVWVDTPEQRQRVVDLYSELGSVRAVARTIGTDTDKIRPTLEAAGVTLKPGGTGKLRFTKEQGAEIRREYEAGASLRSLAQKYQNNSQTIGLTIQRAGGQLRHAGRGQYWTPEREAYVVEQYLAGRSQQQIANELGVGQSPVSRVLNRNGLKKDRMSGANHPSWRGGRCLNADGYVWVMPQDDDLNYCKPMSGGYVLEHRLVMGRSLGRKLASNETVHHIDGDRTNNSLENLQLRFGNHGKGVVLTCQDCGSHRVEAAPLAE